MLHLCLTVANIYDYSPGLILSRLDVTIALNNTTSIPMSSSSGLTTTPKLSITVAPATGLGHFNVSCILLDISCSVTVDLHVSSKVCYKNVVEVLNKRLNIN